MLSDSVSRLKKDKALMSNAQVPSNSSSAQIKALLPPAPPSAQPKVVEKKPDPKNKELENRTHIAEQSWAEMCSLNPKEASFDKVFETCEKYLAAHDDMTAERKRLGFSYLV